MSNDCVSARCRRDRVQGREVEVSPQTQRGKGSDAPTALCWLASLLAPTVWEILVSYQNTFLERRRIGPGKRSCIRHQLVGKVLSYFLLCTSSWQRALSGIWSMSLLRDPSRPATPRLEQGCREGGQMNRGCSPGYWVTQLEVKAKTANWASAVSSQICCQMVRTNQFFWASVFPSTYKILWRI